MRSAAKTLCLLAAFVLVSPSILSFYLRSSFMGKDRALEGSTQTLSLVPGIIGQYLRRAFLMCAIADCHASSTVEFGTIFSQTGARLGRNVYVGPHCHLGLVQLEDNVLVAAGVHIPSGRHTHGIDDTGVPIQEQGRKRVLVRVGAGTWIGSAAIVMSDVGPASVVGAGAVVTKPLPGNIIAAGVPARILRARV
jgi:acetyltransferase-like isoleucine patch superfamily enzyme